MTIDDSPFEFSPRWYELGILTPEVLAALRAESDGHEERFHERYRWGAFAMFLAARRPLPAALAEALYELGEREGDRRLGRAIMHEIVELPECPRAVLEKARAAGRDPSGDSLSYELFWILHGEPAPRGSGGLEPAYELEPLAGRPDLLAFLRTVPARTSPEEVKRLAVAYCAAHPLPPADDDTGDDP